MSATRQPAGPSTLRASRSRAAVARLLVTAALLLAADLVTKAVTFDRVAGAPVTLARDANGQLPPLPAHEPVIVASRILGLHLTVNEGAVFGLGRGGRWIFVLFSFVATAVIIHVFLRSPPRARVLHIALGAVLAGAMGNLYDRLRFGVVRDMLWLFPDVKLPFGLRWPDGADGLYPWIFNVADVCLVGGLLVLMALLYLHDRRMIREQEEDREHLRGFRVRLPKAEAEIRETRKELRNQGVRSSPETK
ncbi:MAG: signal peptidase II [Planctomycetes bacterium]|nr:signal peptidase II [Planctomycetota bacterium]